MVLNLTLRRYRYGCLLASFGQRTADRSCLLKLAVFPFIFGSPQKAVVIPLFEQTQTPYGGGPLVEVAKKGYTPQNTD